MGKKVRKSKNCSLKVSQRVIKEALFYIEHDTSIREVAKKFEVCKSTIHHDFRVLLKDCDYGLYTKVAKILDTHRDTATNKMNEINRLSRIQNNFKKDGSS